MSQIPIIKQLDGKAAGELRLLILTRLAWIDETYPVVGSTERVRSLENVIHLINEIGLTVDDFDTPEVTK